MDLPVFLGDPPLGFRFGVLFLVGGVVPNPIDTLFRKVSGLSSTVETTKLRQGGENLASYQLPNYVVQNNLILERGFVLGSPLVIEFNAAMSLFKFVPSNVLVTLLSEESIPLAAWLCIKAFPVKWSVSDLDADANQVVIETMELAYQRLQVIRV